MKQQPPSLPLPAEWQRCLGSGLYQGDICHRADDCARYLTLPHDQPAITPMHRACSSELMVMHLPMAGFPEETE